MNQGPPELIIAMPAYNESECIEAVSKKWLGSFDTLKLSNAKLIIVNDGSKDNTGAILEEVAKKDPRLLVVNQQNGGHGNALLNAYKKALEFSPAWVFHTDSDDQFSPADLKVLWEKRNQSKFILGYRQVRHDAFHRLVITKILVVLNFILFRVFLKDSNVPFRLIQGDYLKKLLSVLPPDLFAPNIFLTALAARDGQDLMHIPISHEDRKTGQVSIVKFKLIKVCFRTAKELFLFSMSLNSRVRALNS
jgi:dolichol-phosphate mannosyltransferase